MGAYSEAKIQRVLKRMSNEKRRTEVAKLIAMFDRTDRIGLVLVLRDAESHGKYIAARNLIAKLPKSHGLNPHTWFYLYRSLGIMPSERTRIH